MTALALQFHYHIFVTYTDGLRCEAYTEHDRDSAAKRLKTVRKFSEDFDKGLTFDVEVRHAQQVSRLAGRGASYHQYVQWTHERGHFGRHCRYVAARKAAMQRHPAARLPVRDAHSRLIVGQTEQASAVVFRASDGAVVVQIDTNSATTDRVRVNINDSTVFDRGVESGVAFIH